MPTSKTLALKALFKDHPLCQVSLYAAKLQLYKIKTRSKRKPLRSDLARVLDSKLYLGKKRQFDLIA